ncbi:MAG: cysteine desulfurase family protein [Saprospiraceae bacterium]
MDRIYFDNAASTPLLPEVIDIMCKSLVQYMGNPSSIHQEGRTARSKIEEARKSIAKSLHASIGEIFFTSGGTESINTSIKCAVRDLGVSRIITSPLEHHAVLHSIEAMNRDFQIETIFLKVDHLGRIDLKELEDLLKNSDKKSLVALMHINNEIGNIYPIQEVGKLCFENKATFFTDAVQSLGHFHLDLSLTHIDFLAASAHKFHGPKGIGILYIKQGHKINPFIDGGGQERDMRGGTESIHNIMGMSKALEIAVAEMDSRTNEIKSLKQHFANKVMEINPAIKINGDQDHSTYTILSVSFPPSHRSDMLLPQFDMAGISVSGGSACVSGAEQESHVLNAILHPPQRKTIRFSFSHFNSIEEVDKICTILKSWYQV